MLRKAVVIILKLVLVLSCLYSLLITTLQWFGYIYARSPDCDELNNSIYVCNTSLYLSTAIIGTFISVILVGIVIIVGRKEIKKT